jgi:hypothetical protein
MVALLFPELIGAAPNASVRQDTIVVPDPPNRKFVPQGIIAWQDHKAILLMLMHIQNARQWAAWTNAPQIPTGVLWDIIVQKDYQDTQVTRIRVRQVLSLGLGLQRKMTVTYLAYRDDTGKRTQNLAVIHARTDIIAVA